MKQMCFFTIVKPALVTTYIKLQSNLLLVTTSIKLVKPAFSDHLY
jgi:hypothetical protein